MSAKQVSDARSEGVKVGQSVTDLVGFWGVSPADQPASGSQAAVSTTTSSAASTTTITTASTTTSPAGYATTTQANDVAAIVGELRTGYNIIRTLNYQYGVFINQLRTDLVEIGIIKGSA